MIQRETEKSPNYKEMDVQANESAKEIKMPVCANDVI